MPPLGLVMAKVLLTNRNGAWALLLGRDLEQVPQTFSPENFPG